MTNPVLFRNIREQIANHIRTEVLAGRFAKGEPLREVQLAERFGVSRGPIRDALMQLTQEGLLVAEPNVGVRVHNGPSHGIQPLVVSLRRQIERFALDLAWDSLTLDDDRRWMALTEQLREACETGDQGRVIELDMAFHRSIVDRAGDSDLVQMWLPIITRMLLIYSRHNRLIDVYNEHAAIVDAIQRRDRQHALHALEANIV